MSPEQLNHYSQANLAPNFSATLQLYGPGILAFVLTALAMPPYIGWLKKLHIDQQLREEGPKSHAHKAKTPTMGGLCFMLATVVSFALVQAFWPIERSALSDSAVVMAVGLLCGLIGFVDDAAKVRQKANKGISALLRLSSETIFGFVLGSVLSSTSQLWLVLPHSFAQFLGLHVPALALDQLGQMQQCNAYYFLPLPAIAALLLGAALVASTTNAVNLHDGMDGLATGTAIQVFATIALMLFSLNQMAYATISATACLALLGFLIYNKNPAKIFMGDTGSLFIGGLMAALVLAGGLAFYFVLVVSWIYIAEALSVIAQVTYFKLTKPYKPEKPMSWPALTVLKLTKRLPGEGKRLLRMAPLHHHFEAVLCPQGWTESQVVGAFWFVQSLLCLVTLALFYLWH